MAPLLALVVFSAQLLVVVAVAAIAETVGRVTHPRLRFAYWRGVALACLALPLSAIVGPDAGRSGVTFLASSVEGAEATPIGAALPETSLIVWSLLGAGVLTRLGWLCLGAVRLRQLRHDSRAALLTPDIEAIRSAVAPRAEIRVSDEVAQPAGFGLRRPIVLVPDGFFAMDPQAQSTVVYHELLHVARRDWPWIVAEEVARSLFWFHPGVWWMVEQIQESREQLVDRLVIAGIPSKRAYMTALLAFADSGRPAVLATAILRQRQLRSRLQNLGKESAMSRRSLVWTAVALAGVMTGAVAGTVTALPIGWPAGAATSPTEQVVDGKDPDVTLPKVVSEMKPEYTLEALQAKIQGTVLLTAVIRTDGTPEDIVITQSLDTQYGLDQQAVAALGEWRFEPGQKHGRAVPVRVTVEVRFSLK